MELIFELIAFTLVSLLLVLPLSWVLARYLPLGNGPTQQASSAIGIMIAVIVAKGIRNQADLSSTGIWLWETALFVPGIVLSWFLLRWLLKKKVEQSD